MQFVHNIKPPHLTNIFQINEGTYFRLMKDTVAILKQPRRHTPKLQLSSKHFMIVKGSPHKCYAQSTASFMSMSWPV